MRELFVSGLSGGECKPGAGVMSGSWSPVPGGHSLSCHQPRDKKIHEAGPDTGESCELSFCFVSIACHCP